MLRILGEALALQGRVDQVNRTEGILLGDLPAFHGLVKNADEDLTHETRMIMQMRGTLPGHLATQAHAGLHVVAADHLQVGANVDAQTYEGIRLGFKTLFQDTRKLTGHLAHVGEQQHLFVREVVVNRRAPNTRTFSDLTHGDRLEGLLPHQRPQRLKEARTSQLAMRGEGLPNNLRHALILTSFPYVSSNGRACGTNRIFTQQHRSELSRTPVSCAPERTAGLSASAAGDHGLDNRQVSDDPRQRGEVREGHPPGLEMRRTHARRGRAGRDLGEPHAHDAHAQDWPPVAILGTHALADGQVCAELFRNLTRQGSCWVLAFLDLAAGQLELSA